MTRTLARKGFPVNSWRVVAAALLPAFVGVFLVALLPCRSDARNPYQIYDEQSESAQSTATSVGTDTVYYEDFSSGPAGWVARDFTEQTGVYWHQATYEARGVMWCGTEGDAWWVTPPGYGNNWDQYLSKSFEIPDAAEPDVTFSMQHHAEPDYDFVRLEVTANGGDTWDVLAAYTGASAGFETHRVDLSAYRGQTVMLRFRFTSDAAYSDEDGLWDSNGGARLDAVQVTGYPADTFEWGTDGWVASPRPPVGGGPYRLKWWCSPAGTCRNSWLATDPGEACDDPLGCGPGFAVFPFAPEGEDRSIRIGIESPVIEIDPCVRDAQAYRLEFDVYRHLPLLNGVFVYWEVSVDGGRGRSHDFVYYGHYQTDFYPMSFDITRFIPPGATTIQIRLKAFDLADAFGLPGAVHTAAPIFSTVRVTAEIPAIGTIAGRVTADCPWPGTPLLGVTVDAYQVGSGQLAASAVTGSNGAYAIECIPTGDYIVSIVTPPGYEATPEEATVSVVGGQTASADFSLACRQISSPRSIGFWKHQVGVATGGNGTAQIASPTLCQYLDLIEGHFNSNRLNPVIVYEPPASGICADKLAVAKSLLNLEGSTTMLSRARQQFMALLLNVASGKIGLRAVVSLDGATLSQAITYCDRLVTDSDMGNDEIAKNIAETINGGKMVARGIILLETPDIAYGPEKPGGGDVPIELRLYPNVPNPFNPTTLIRYDVPENGGSVALRIYDVTGRLVRTLVEGMQSAGEKSATWNGRDNAGRPVASGVYFYRLTAPGFVEVRKMVLLQ